MVILSRVFVVNRSGFLLPLERATGRIIPQPPRRFQYPADRFGQGDRIGGTVTRRQGDRDRAATVPRPASLAPPLQGLLTGFEMGFETRRQGDRIGNRAPHAPQPPAVAFAQFGRVTARGNRAPPLWRFLCRPRGNCAADRIGNRAGFGRGNRSG